MNAQDLINNTEIPEWNKEDFMAKFYPIEAKVLKKEKPQSYGFKMLYRKPSVPNAPEIVKIVEDENVRIKRPLFDSNKTKKGFFRRFWK